MAVTPRIRRPLVLCLVLGNIVSMVGGLRQVVWRRHAAHMARGAPQLSAASKRASFAPRASRSASEIPLRRAPRMSLASERAGLKADVFAAISEVRRSRSPEAYGVAREAFLRALAALEGTPSNRRAIDGRWSLVYSTDISGLAPAARAQADPLQQAFNQAYKIFFRFAPALAGGQDVAFLGAANEQVVDLAAGTIDNTVTLRLPATAGRRPVQICVRGLVSPEGSGGDGSDNAFAITFTESELRTPLGSVKVPLPRPRGVISSTFCDGETRVVRGSRGTLFVLQRLVD
jgi:hypothetical protein